MVNLVLYCTCLFLYERFMFAHHVLIGQTTACWSKSLGIIIMCCLLSFHFSLRYIFFKKEKEIALSEEKSKPQYHS